MNENQGRSDSQPAVGTNGEAGSRGRIAGQPQTFHDKDQHLAAILTSSSDAIISVGLDRLVQSWNPAATRLFGYAESEAVGATVDNLIVPDLMQSQVLAVYPAILATKQGSIYETMRRCKDGSLVSVEVNVSPMFDADGNVCAVSAIYRDITERTGTLRSLRDSELLNRTLLTSIDQGFCIIELIFDAFHKPVDYRFLEVNPSFEQQSGLHGAAGRRIREFVPDLEAYWFEIYGKVLLTGKPARFVSKAQDLEERWFDVYACRLGSADANKIAILFSDITQRKRAEEALRDSAAKLQIGVATAGVGLGSIDYLTGMTVLDDTAAAFFALPAHVPMPRDHVHARFHASDAADIAAAICNAAGPASTGLMSFDHRIVRPDGSVRWVNARKQMQFAVGADGARQLVSGLFAVRDITDRIGRIDALRESESFSRRILEANPDCIKILDLGGNVEFINSNGCALLEIDDFQAHVGVPWASIWPANDRKMIEKTIAAAGMGVESRFEAECPTRKGTLKWWDVIVTPVLDAQGQVLRIITTSRDISRRKDAEKMLANNEERLRLAVDAARLTFVDVDFASKQSWSAENYGSVMGFAGSSAHPGGTDMIATKLRLLAHVAPPDRERVEAAMQEFFDGCPAGQIEYRVRGDDGIERWIESRWSNKAAAGGRQQRAFVTNIDISERKRAEEKLRESRARLNHAADAARLTYVEIDFARNRLFTADNFASVMGYASPSDEKADEATGAHMLLDHVVKADCLRVEIALREFMSGNNLGKVEYRVVGDDRTERWIESMWSVDFDAQGRPLRAFATNLDITERKRSEEHARLILAEVNHRARNLLGVVQAVARQTARRGDAATFVDRLSERIGSLAASHDLLVENGWKGVDLADLVKIQLGHFKDLIGKRILLDGLPVRLMASSAQGIGMALHELATNAVKYGALSNADGIVRVSWGVVPADTALFLISWTETGGPTVVAPTRIGFGNMVIGRMAEAAVDGTAHIGFKESGLIWTLSAPAASMLEAKGFFVHAP